MGFTAISGIANKEFLLRFAALLPHIFPEHAIMASTAFTITKSGLRKIVWKNIKIKKKTKDKSKTYYLGK